jgi:hypothetical protein
MAQAARKEVFESSADLDTVEWCRDESCDRDELHPVHPVTPPRRAKRRCAACGGRLTGLHDARTCLTCGWRCPPPTETAPSNVVPIHERKPA